MKNELRITLLLGFSFALVFFAFETIQSLNVAIFKERGMAQLGFINLALIYVAFGTSSMNAHKVFEKFDLKTSMMIA